MDNKNKKANKKIPERLRMDTSIVGALMLYLNNYRLHLDEEDAFYMFSELHKYIMKVRKSGLNACDYSLQKRREFRDKWEGIHKMYPDIFSEDGNYTGTFVNPREPREADPEDTMPSAESIITRLLREGMVKRSLREPPERNEDDEDKKDSNSF